MSMSIAECFAMIVMSHYYLSDLGSNVNVDSRLNCDDSYYRLQVQLNNHNALKLSLQVSRSYHYYYYCYYISRSIIRSTKMLELSLYCSTISIPLVMVRTLSIRRIKYRCHLISDLAMNCNANRFQRKNPYTQRYDFQKRIRFLNIRESVTFLNFQDPFTIQLFSKNKTIKFLYFSDDKSEFFYFILLDGLFPFHRPKIICRTLGTRQE